MLYSEPAERDRLTALMSLINWDNEARKGNPDVSVCPDTLETVLNQHRWSMLENALLDWDIMCGRKQGAPHDAAFRLGQTYVPEVFESVGPEVDRALGHLIQQYLDADEVAEALGRRWRDDLCATSWEMRLKDRAKEHELERSSSTDGLNPTR